MAETIRVEVAYADPQRQVLLAVAVAAGSTVTDAIAASGILAQLPGFVPAGIGIFGRLVEPDTLLRDGDRVELYRPLQIDPKQARRNRVRGQLP
jgi:putative ubiquitin-RnfH superfamily antitoxin RatB of RatAB toxin-antitoxin module